jgi:transcription elongation GreA/GreB family factor
MASRYFDGYRGSEQTLTFALQGFASERHPGVVGEPEADVRSGKLSIGSPIARALIGKTIGDTVQVSTPGGGKSYEVTAVRFG